MKKNVLMVVDLRKKKEKSVWAYVYLSKTILFGKVAEWFIALVC